MDEEAGAGIEVVVGVEAGVDTEVGMVGVLAVVGVGVGDFILIRD